MSDKIWEYAELGFYEYKSSELLAKTLKENGFNVDLGVAAMPTAFVATYGSGKPVIAVLGEFDALPGLSQAAEPIRKPLKEGAPGHGCGHNLLGTAGVGAVLAVKEAIDAGEVEGTIRFYGCPAEEIFNAKGYMINPGGVFENIDISITWHPGSFTGIALQSNNALNSVFFKFYGRTAHAAADPYNGRSALDAVELMNVGANYMREHMIPDARLHYVITNGGLAPNIVPAEAEVHYFVRAPERHQVDELYDRLVNIAKGAVLMTETRVEIDFISGIYNPIRNDVVNNVIY
ncbi:MAG: amidohydrolase, partial [Candidatus Thorarchaeota archaeon]